MDGRKAAPVAGTAAPGGAESLDVVTGEYPPQPGGVSDYSYLLARELAARGAEVHVWCPAATGHTPGVSGVTVHRVLGRIAPADLRRVDAELDRLGGPRRLIVQWVPQGFGYRGLNLRFCLWLRRRARLHGDRVEVMFHEAFVAFGGGAKQWIAAGVHRVMAAVLLSAASRVWVSNPFLARMLRPYARGAEARFEWLPVPSNVPVAGDGEASERVRARYVPQGGSLLGHFGTYGAHVAPLLREVVPAVLKRSPGASFLLIGRGGVAVGDQLRVEHPELAGRIHATGGLAAEALSHHLAACDLMVQPYPEGVSTRRGSMMACLAHGRATVSTHGRITEALWEGAVALVRSSDGARIVDVVLALLSDAGERARLSDAARELYARRFSIEHTVAELQSPLSSGGRRGGA